MKKAIIAIAMLVAGVTTHSFAQAKRISPLKIGDQLPDITFYHVIGYEKNIVNTSDFRGKILILDYWATWCHSCIEGFAKNDSLQTSFGKDIEIMLVDTKGTRDDEHNVEGFYQRRSKMYPDFKLPSVYLDTVMDRLSPHRSIPHCVWVNKKGIVIAITGSEEVNAENIEKAIKDDELRLPVKTM